MVGTINNCVKEKFYKDVAKLLIKKECSICKEEFETEFPEVIHWCSGKCREKYRVKTEEGNND